MSRSWRQGETEELLPDFPGDQGNVTGNTVGGSELHPCDIRDIPGATGAWTGGQDSMATELEVSVNVNGWTVLGWNILLCWKTHWYLGVRDIMSPDGSRKSHYTTHATLLEAWDFKTFLNHEKNVCMCIAEPLLLCVQTLAQRANQLYFNKKIKTFFISHIYSNYAVILSYSLSDLFWSTHLFQHYDIFGNNLSDNWNFVLLICNFVHERYPENYNWLNRHTPMSNICQRPQFILSEHPIHTGCYNTQYPFSTLHRNSGVAILRLPTSTSKFQVFFKTKCPIFCCFLTTQHV